MSISGGFTTLSGKIVPLSPLKLYGLSDISIDVTQICGLGLGDRNVAVRDPVELHVTPLSAYERPSCPQTHDPSVFAILRSPSPVSSCSELGPDEKYRNATKSPHSPPSLEAIQKESCYNYRQPYDQ
jgi:hypothetical protein